MGAFVMGRNLFGPVRGAWSEDWRGWWGDDPPYHAPVFVLTRYAHDPIKMSGGTTFYFADGVDVALERARSYAGGTCSQWPAAGLVVCRGDVYEVDFSDGQGIDNKRFGRMSALRLDRKQRYVGQPCLVKLVEEELAISFCLVRRHPGKCDPQWLGGIPTVDHDLNITHLSTVP
jgi:hypothetical protein